MTSSSEIHRQIARPGSGCPVFDQIVSQCVGAMGQLSHDDVFAAIAHLLRDWVANAAFVGDGTALYRVNTLCRIVADVDDIVLAKRDHVAATLRVIEAQRNGHFADAPGVIQ